jgi:2-polyprenyl-6-methoxyphenol hydroxylase-like FAD-dependent oxidoreductase
MVGMTTQRRYDVAIVGGGIVGCTAATLFAPRGLDSALIERYPDPNVDVAAVVGEYCM